MKIDPNKIISVPLTNYEIQTLLLQLQKCVPDVDDQPVILSVAAKLRAAFRANE